MEMLSLSFSQLWTCNESENQASVVELSTAVSVALVTRTHLFLSVPFFYLLKRS